MKTMHKRVWLGLGLLAVVLLAGRASAQLTMVSQDFEGYGSLLNGSTNSINVRADGWTKYVAGTYTLPVTEEHGIRAGMIWSNDDSFLRYWASPAISGNIWEVSFDARVYQRIAGETIQSASLVVFLSDTNDMKHGYTSYTPIATITVTSTNWTHVTIPINQYDVDSKHVVIGRDKADSTNYSMLIDNIVVSRIPASLTPTHLHLSDGETSKVSNETIDPVLLYSSIGTVTDVDVSLNVRYDNEAWTQVSMVAGGIVEYDGESYATYVLENPLPAQNVANRAFEMYATLSYSNEIDSISKIWPAGGAADPVRIDIVPYSPWSGLTVENDLEAELLLVDNQVWRGAALVTDAVAAPEFWFEDSASGKWGSRTPTGLPAFGTVSAGANNSFQFSTSVEKSVAFSFDETTGEYVAQATEYEPFEGGNLQAGWSTTSVSVSGTDGAQGQGGLTTANNAAIESPNREGTGQGVGEVSFWACMADANNSSAYTIKVKRFGNWETVQTGTIAGGFWRYYSLNVADYRADQVRLEIARSGVKVDEMMATHTGAYVVLSDPVWTTNAVPQSAQVGVVPMAQYAQAVSLAVTADNFNGASISQVEVVYTHEDNPTATNRLAMAGSAAGGVFSVNMPMQAIGELEYWYEVEFTGLNAAPARLPEVDVLSYVTDGALGDDRQPDMTSWPGTPTYIPGANIGSAYPGDTNLPQDSRWRIQNMRQLDYILQFDLSFTTSRLRSPQLNGVGAVYFNARPDNPSQADAFFLTVELARSSLGTAFESYTVEVPKTAEFNPFRIPFNNFESGLFVRIRSSATGAGEVGYIHISDVVITPPSADVVVKETSVTNPGYPSQVTPITFQAEVKDRAATGSYRSSNFAPKLVWRWGTNAWDEVDMEPTTGSKYEATLPAQEAGPMEYYYKVDFDGPHYFYTLGEDEFDENRSPAFLTWDNESFVNTVQTFNTNNVPSVKTPRMFRVRMFDSTHQKLNLGLHQTGETFEMDLVGDHTWQTVLYFTNAVNSETAWTGLNYYTPGATAFGLVQSWGDTNQFTINPPLYGSAVVNGEPNIEIEMDYVGFVMFRLNTDTREYQVRRAVFQDFNRWQASDDYFEESVGLYAIKTYATDFEELTPSAHANFLYTFDTESPAVRMERPFEAFPMNETEDVTGWTVVQGWLGLDRKLEQPFANIAVQLDAGAGYLRSKASASMQGRENLDFKYRVAYDDENMAHFRNGFGWDQYEVRSIAKVGAVSPGHASISLIGYYWDNDNFYEMRLTQADRTSVNQERVEGRIYRKKEGVYTALGSARTFNNVSLANNNWDMRFTLTTTNTTVYVAGTFKTEESALQTITRVTDNSAGDLMYGGTIAVNAADTLVNFSELEVINLENNGPMSGFSNNNSRNWHLGGNRLESPAVTRWQWLPGGELRREPPTMTFDVEIVRRGTETGLPDDPVWVNVATVTDNKLAYSQKNIPVKVWDNSYVRIKPRRGDGRLVIDDVYTRGWRGISISDPEEGGIDNPAAWIATEAFITPHGATGNAIELTVSRANPAELQTLVSPVMSNGIGIVTFPYDVTGGQVVFRVERNRYDGSFEPQHQWDEVLSVTNNTAGVVDVPVRTNMIGRVRVVVDPLESDPDATLWIDDVSFTDYPPRDTTSWEAYNSLITRKQPDKAFEPTEAEHRTAFLNNDSVDGVKVPSVLADDMPYIQSPEIPTGIGEIGFWYRVWDWDPMDPQPARIKLMMAPSTESTNWVEVTVRNPTTLEVMQPEDQEYKSRLGSITNTVYEYISLEIFDDKNKVLRIYAETNNAARVALDNIIVTEPVRSSIEIKSMKLVPEIPLVGDKVGVDVQLANPRLNPTEVEVYLHYRVGPKNYGAASPSDWYAGNWGSTNYLAQNFTTIKLTKDPHDGFHFYVPQENGIPALGVDEVVQYRVVVTYDGRFPSPVEYVEFENPSWYYPVDLNRHFGVSQDDVQLPYYFVFSCPTGAVFINEFFYSQLISEANREFIEIIGPQYASMANWRVDVVNAMESEFEDYVVTSYQLPNSATTYRGGANNKGWGTYVIGDTGAALDGLVDYVMEDGGNPLMDPPEIARFPSSGGFRLVRGMGAYADLVSYGSHPNAGALGPMAQRGYTYAGYQPNLEVFLRASIGLAEVEYGDEVIMGWALIAEPGTPGKLNPFQETLLPEVDPFDNPEGTDPAVLALVISDIQLTGGNVIISVDAWSENDIDDLRGWVGVLQTNSSPAGGDVGWGNTAAVREFSAEDTYDFTVPEAGFPLFFRIRAEYQEP